MVVYNQPKNFWNFSQNVTVRHFGSSDWEMFEVCCIIQLTFQERYEMAHQLIYR